MADRQTKKFHRPAPYYLPPRNAYQIHPNYRHLPAVQLPGPYKQTVTRDDYENRHFLMQYNSPLARLELLPEPLISTRELNTVSTPVHTIPMKEEGRRYRLNHQITQTPLSNHVKKLEILHSISERNRTRIIELGLGMGYPEPRVVVDRGVAASETEIEFDLQYFKSAKAQEEYEDIPFDPLKVSVRVDIPTGKRRVMLLPSLLPPQPKTYTPTVKFIPPLQTTSFVPSHVDRILKYIKADRKLKKKAARAETQNAKDDIKIPSVQKLQLERNNIVPSKKVHRTEPASESSSTPMTVEVNPYLASTSIATDTHQMDLFPDDISVATTVEVEYDPLLPSMEAQAEKNAKLMESLLMDDKNDDTDSVVTFPMDYDILDSD